MVLHGCLNLRCCTSCCQCIYHLSGGGYMDDRCCTSCCQCIYHLSGGVYMDAWMNFITTGVMRFIACGNIIQP